MTGDLAWNKYKWFQLVPNLQPIANRLITSLNHRIIKLLKYFRVLVYPSNKVETNYFLLFMNWNWKAILPLQVKRKEIDRISKSVLILRAAVAYLNVEGGH